MRTRVLMLASLAIAAACRGADRGATGENGGTMVISVAGDASGFLPPLTTDAISSQLEAQMFDKLAEPPLDLNTIGDAGYQPRLARSWTWAPDSLSIAFALDPRARWHDGKPVTARDVRFTWEIFTDAVVGSPLKPLVASIDSVTIRDSLTAVFWFRNRAPEQFFTATYQMRILPEHVLGAIPRGEIKTAPFRRNPVGDGPFRFVRWDAGQAIVLQANPDYYRGRPHLDRVIWSIAPDPQSTILRLFSGEADFVEYLRPVDVAEIPKHPELKAVWFPAHSYGYVLFNLRDPKQLSAPHPIFADRAVRRALSMALDRASIVKSAFDTLSRPAMGPVLRTSSMYDSTIAPPPYAVDSAKRLLDDAGWRVSGANGMRSKNGRPLAFSLRVPSSSTTRRQMAVLIQEAFRQVGAKVEVEQEDYATHMKRMDARDFDASIENSLTDPSPASILQVWGVEAAALGGNNWGSYASRAFDAYVDTASRQFDAARAKAYYRLAYATIIGDAPAIWLYEPSTVPGMQKRVHPSGARADSWSVNLADWTIPPAERTARDRASLDASTKP